MDGTRLPGGVAVRCCSVGSQRAHRHRGQAGDHVDGGRPRIVVLAVIDQSHRYAVGRTPPSGKRSPPGAVVDTAAVALGLGLGAVLGLAVSAESRGSLAAPGGLATFAGRLAGLTGSYLLLVMVLLVARIPAVERAVGQDRLLAWHRRLGQWPIYLLGAHAVLLTVGYAQLSRTGAWHQLGVFLDSYPDVLAATVAFGLLLMAAVTSIRAARRRMRYETWWAVHLYVYLALALSLSHQLANGASFVGHPLTRFLWLALWASTAGVVIAYRVAMPVARSLWHRLRVVSVTEEAPGVVSVVCAGRHVERLAVAGGQFLQWRFLARGMWWQAHPYSLSALPHPPYLRVTVKALGDHSSDLARLAIGTRVAVEGPYGAFTSRARRSEKVLLVGAGVGVTPVRALLEELPATVDVVVVTRASTTEGLLFRQEIRAMVAGRGGRLHELVGPRATVSLDRNRLRHLVPDIAERDVYVCGPQAMTGAVTQAARRLGVAEDRLHCEAFAF